MVYSHQRGTSTLPPLSVNGGLDPHASKAPVVRDANGDGAGKCQMR